MHFSKSRSDSDLSSSDEECTVITTNGVTKVIRGHGIYNFGGIQIGSGRTRVLSGHRRKSRGKYPSKQQQHDSPCCSHVFSEYGQKPESWEYSKGRKQLSDSDDPPSRSDLNYVSKHIGRHWKSLASGLGLSRGEIETIEWNNRGEGLYEMAYQTLLKWERQNGGFVTIKDLVNVLDSIEMTKIAAGLPVR
ncbi:hypothetical protein ACF0H5_004914 [Mactra antiquata]